MDYQTVDISVPGAGISTSEFINCLNLSSDPHQLEYASL
jgi:hypothetical protein